MSVITGRRAESMSILQDNFIRWFVSETEINTHQSAGGIGLPDQAGVSAI